MRSLEIRINERTNVYSKEERIVLSEIEWQIKSLINTTVGKIEKAVFPPIFSNNEQFERMVCMGYIFEGGEPKERSLKSENDITC